MRKTLSILSIIFFIASCNTVDRKETLKEEIKQHKEEVSQLNIKIAELGIQESRQKLHVHYAKIEALEKAIEAELQTNDNILESEKIRAKKERKDKLIDMQASRRGKTREENTKYDNAFYQQSIHKPDITPARHIRNDAAFTTYSKYISEIVGNFDIVQRNYQLLKRDGIDKISPDLMDDYNESYDNLSKVISKFAEAMYNPDGVGAKILSYTKALDIADKQLSEFHGRLVKVVNEIEDSHKWVNSMYNYDSSSSSSSSNPISGPIKSSVSDLLDEEDD